MYFPLPITVTQFLDFWALFFLNDGTFEPPELSTATAIGITVAIAGNILISLALNLQKLAHRRVERARVNSRTQNNAPVPNGSSTNQNAVGNMRGRDANRGISGRIDDDRLEEAEFDDNGDVFRGRPSRALGAARHNRLETQNLLSSSGRDYGAGTGSSSIDQKQASRKTFLSKFIPRRLRSRLPGGWGDRVRSNDRPQASALNGSSIRAKPKFSEDHNESDYLKSKLWWFGFLLMNIGELGNFISYAFAPASVVAPLGTFALMANCIFAPLMHGEQFRKMDLVGIFIAIMGAITVVLSSNTSDVRLDPEALIRAISQHLFIAFTCLYIVGAIILAILSRGRIGRKWVFVDVGLCALFGGFTVLSTKAISTLLTLEWFEMFAQWITYPVIFVLILTGVGQVKYLNRALMRFDSKVVIPIQFVLFTLSAIVGSAILYGDFKTATFHQLVTFFYGCVATFLGVFIIAWVPSNYDEVADEDAPESGEILETAVSSGGTRAVVGDRSNHGTFSGRSRPMIGAEDTPSIRKRQSIINIGIGVSPVQHLLLVHTPPRDIADRRLREADVERDSVGSVDPLHLRRVIGWFDEETRRRDGSLPRARDESMTRPW